MQIPGPRPKEASCRTVRFVQACVNGHISDLDWHDFVHRGRSSCKRQLWMDERGTSGDLADIFARCECGQSRSLAEAAEMDKRPLGYCKGLRPWLGAASQEKCGGDQGTPEINRLLVRSASNAYFPQVLSVISIPDRKVSFRRRSTQSGKISCSMPTRLTTCARSGRRRRCLVLSKDFRMRKCSERFNVEDWGRALSEKHKAG